MSTASTIPKIPEPVRSALVEALDLIFYHRIENSFNTKRFNEARQWLVENDPDPELPDES